MSPRFFLNLMGFVFALSLISCTKTGTVTSVGGNSTINNGSGGGSGSAVTTCESLGYVSTCPSGRSCTSAGITLSGVACLSVTLPNCPAGYYNESTSCPGQCKSETVVVSGQSRTCWAVDTSVPDTKTKLGLTAEWRTFEASPANDRECPKNQAPGDTIHGSECLAIVQGGHEPNDVCTGWPIRTCGQSNRWYPLYLPGGCQAVCPQGTQLKKVNSGASYPQDPRTWGSYWYGNWYGDWMACVYAEVPTAGYLAELDSNGRFFFYRDNGTTINTDQNCRSIAFNSDKPITRIQRLHNGTTNSNACQFTAAQSGAKVFRFDDGSGEKFLYAVKPTFSSKIRRAKCPVNAVSLNKDLKCLLASTPPKTSSWTPNATFFRQPNNGKPVFELYYEANGGACNSSDTIASNGLTCFFSYLPPSSNRTAQNFFDVSSITTNSADLSVIPDSTNLQVGQPQGWYIEGRNKENCN